VDESILEPPADGSAGAEVCLKALVGGKLPVSVGELDADRLKAWGAEPDEADAKEAAAQKRTWRALETEAGRAFTTGATGEIKKALDPHLDAIAANMIVFERPCSADQVPVRFLAAASNYYRMIWARLTDQERLVLIQLAKEGYVNPNNWWIVTPLLHRGLLRHSQGIQLMNESFKQFVKSEEKEARVHEWEQAAGASTWDRVRNVLLIVIIVGGLLTYLTQPELLARWIGALTAIGGAATTFISMLGLFRASGIRASSPMQ
jgi:hypothetical protein